MARQEGESTDMVALTISDDGRRTYCNIESGSVIRGTNIAPYLPRSIWSSALVAAHIDPSEHSESSCSRGTHDEDDGNTCPVCLETLEEGCVVSCFPCSHTLHWQCASAWLTARITDGKPGTCPLWYAPCHHLHAPGVCDSSRSCRRSAAATGNAAR